VGTCAGSGRFFAWFRAGWRALISKKCSSIKIHKVHSFIVLDWVGRGGSRISAFGPDLALISVRIMIFFCELFMIKGPVFGALSGSYPTNYSSHNWDVCRPAAGDGAERAKTLIFGFGIVFC
jgi:hypothetical protein